MHSDAKRSTSLVLTCSDMRLQGAGNLARFLAEEPTIGPVLRDGYDLIAVPGACLAFRGTVSERETIPDYVGMLVDLHQQETIVLVQHTDCGRYGLLEGGCNDGVLLADMAGSAVGMRRRFPRLRVIQALAEVDAFRTVGLRLVSDIPAIG